MKLEDIYPTCARRMDDVLSRRGQTLRDVITQVTLEGRYAKSPRMAALRSIWNATTCDTLLPPDANDAHVDTLLRKYSAERGITGDRV